MTFWPKDRTQWTDRDLGRLRRLAGQVRVSTIARLLGRTPQAVRAKASVEGISLAVKKPAPGSAGVSFYARRSGTVNLGAWDPKGHTKLVIPIW
jgi:hypothetical protein